MNPRRPWKKEDEIESSSEDDEEGDEKMKKKKTIPLFSIFSQFGKEKENIIPFPILEYLAQIAGKNQKG